VAPPLYPFPRVLLLVLDSVGIGELPDASAYGDAGSNTLGNIAAQIPLRLPNLRRLGLDHVVSLGAHATTGLAGQESVDRGSLAPIGAYGRMIEASAGKDSVTGHWEMAGVVLERPFPTFPHGFPAEVIAAFEARIGRRTLGNVVASGTEVIDRLGPEHLATGAPIVYTSADSVFQIAAHEDVIPLAEQYRNCEIAFELVARGMGVGRVIARPFVGRPGAFARTSNRHDYALEPHTDTLLDRLVGAGVQVLAVGKVADLFAGRGITRTIRTTTDAEGMAAIHLALRECPEGLVFANLVDFDTLYGHRNDVAGYAANLERFDDALGMLLPALADGDLLIVTADHGNDPTTPSTDHSREHVPLLIAGRRVRRGLDLGTRSTYADVGQTVAANFGVGPLAHGRSVLEEIRADHP
jgi:phosphopentomutase